LSRRAFPNRVRPEPYLYFGLAFALLQRPPLGLLYQEGMYILAWRLHSGPPPPPPCQGPRSWLRPSPRYSPPATDAFTVLERVTRHFFFFLPFLLEDPPAQLLRGYQTRSPRLLLKLAGSFRISEACDSSRFFRGRALRYRPILRLSSVRSNCNFLPLRTRHAEGLQGSTIPG